MKERSEKTLSILIFVLAIVFIAYGVFIYYPHPEDRASWGQFGDAFGLFNGLAFIIAMYALYLQKQENHKAEEARKKRDYSNIAFEIVNLIYSKQYKEATDVIISFNTQHENEYKKICKLYYECFSKNDFKDIGIENGNVYTKVYSAAKQIQGIFHKIYVLYKLEVIDERFIGSVLTQTDLFNILLTMPIFAPIPYENNDIFEDVIRILLKDNKKGYKNIIEEIQSPKCVQ